MGSFLVIHSSNDVTASPEVSDDFVQTLTEANDTVERFTSTTGHSFWHDAPGSSPSTDHVQVPPEKPGKLTNAGRLHFGVVTAR